MLLNKPILCPFCKKENDASTPASKTEGDEARQGPSPGSISVCLYCAGVSIFNEDMSVRALSDSDLALMEGDDVEAINRAVAAVRTFIHIRAWRKPKT